MYLRKMCIIFSGKTLARDFTKHRRQWKRRNPAPGLLCAEEYVVRGQGNGRESDWGTDAGSPNGPVNLGGHQKRSSQKVCCFLSWDLCGIRAHQTQGMSPRSSINLKKKTVPKYLNTSQRAIESEGKKSQVSKTTVTVPLIGWPLLYYYSSNEMTWDQRVFIHCETRLIVVIHLS